MSTHNIPDQYEKENHDVISNSVMPAAMGFVSDSKTSLKQLW